ncbi:hypothetical protein PP175_02700 [Aneurinibacillus sp. Ricciae_BoGa-3]|uniref:hypothetical protein n=1 Tax=Aneurinibacillus sp. Ricciae_BoGa-3 TaxID=3022697 RepID=UPI002340DEB0|nr:hypothetical protein [Aneurinibacillus sp. Ricciae_BoGa-3]WCK54943.1 hypothetical protein PP175_02700 [Aneurinibacillus sp. Ricciae_BoGa-3]
MSDKFLFVYFDNHDAAERAAHKLAERGVISIKIDRIKEHKNGTMVLEDVLPSETVDGTIDVVNGRDILLTASVEDSLYHEAINIVRKAGGVV